MKTFPKEPFISVERDETIRQSIITFIEKKDRSAKDISIHVSIGEKEVYDHLEHIRKSTGKAFIITPARCRKCNFIFEKRSKLKKPGKCPVCHNQLIEPPLFYIES